MAIRVTSAPDPLTLLTVQEGKRNIFEAQKDRSFGRRPLLNDEAVTAQIHSAYQRVEHYTGRTILPTEYLWTPRRLPWRLQPLPIPRPPVESVSSVRWRFSTDPDWTVIPVELHEDIIYPREAWPIAISTAPFLVEVAYSAGEAAPSPVWKAAMISIIAGQPDLKQLDIFRLDRIGHPSMYAEAY